MSIKWVALFYLVFTVTACTTIDPVEQDGVRPAAAEVISSYDDGELKHGQSLEEKRKGLPTYWN